MRSAVSPLIDGIDRSVESEQDSNDSSSDIVRHRYELLLDTLAERYDALDAAVRDSEIPFAEIDSSGYIAYANDALASLVTRPVGRLFRTLFDDRSAEVQQVLDLGRNSGLRVELRRGDELESYRLEVGPLKDEDGAPGNYAMLWSLRAEELRQEAAQDGILRTGASGVIKFANPRAEYLLSRKPGGLIGVALPAVFTAGPEGRPDPSARWLNSPRGLTEVVELAGSPGMPPHPVRVSVMPCFDEPGRQSGLLINFSSLDEDAAREKLHSLMMLHREPTIVIREAIRTLRGAVPNDMATFGIYSDDLQQFRMLVVDPEPAWQWSTRWFPVAPGVIDWMRSGKTYTDDLGAFMKDRAPDQQDDPVVQAVIKDKLNAMLLLPIVGPGGGYRSCLSLLSRDRSYDADDLRTLQELGLEEILQAADAAMERSQAAELRALKERLNAARSAHDLAITLAKGVVRCFGWEYAGVFRVNRASKRFELFEQFDLTGGELTVDPAYVQGIEEGMLGHSYRYKKVVVLPRIRDDAAQYTDAEGLSFSFIKTAGNRQKSAMVVPLRVRDQVELFLDLESTQTNAFAGPDRAAAEALADDCAKIFEGRWFEAIGSALIDAIDQAAVIVDSAGAIRSVNAAARAMLGICADRTLSSYGAQSADQAVLADARSRNPTRVTLMVAVGDDKSATSLPTLASQRPLNDDYQHRLWLFTNLHEQQWERDWRYLDETVSEVARLTRAPLLVADGLLHSAATLLQQPGAVERCARLLQRAASQLTRVDFTFERLAAAYTATLPPLEPPRLFDAYGVLQHEIQAIGAEDGSLVSLAPATGGFPVLGWPERLAFAFRATLSVALDIRSEEPLPVSTSIESTGWLVVNIPMLARGGIASVSIDDADPIAQGEARVRHMVMTVPDAVQSAVALHGGRCEQGPHDAPSPTFVIRLPPAGAER